jgi:hypothetical protein
VQEEQRLECPESLALYDRLLHEPCPDLLGRAFRLRDRSSLGLGRWALSRIDFRLDDFERPDGGKQFVELFMAT